MTQTTVAAELGRMIDASGKTQREIAQAVGYKKPNFISMMKTGETKVPIEKAPALARACGADPVAFLCLALEEYHLAWWQTLRDELGAPLTDDERALLAHYRVVRAGPMQGSA